MIRTALAVAACLSFAVPASAADDRLAQSGKVGEGKDNKSKKLQPGPDREVKLVIDQKIGSKTGTIEFMGSKKSGFVEGFFKKGADPDFWFSTDEMAITESMVVMAPLPVGLYYVVLINQDGEPLPGKADLVSTPVELPSTIDKKAALTVIVDQKFAAVLDGSFRTEAYPAGTEPLNVGESSPMTEEEKAAEKTAREAAMLEAQRKVEASAAKAKGAKADAKTDAKKADDKK